MRLPLAVLVNAEAIPARHYPTIAAIATSLGEPVVFRVYGDFSAPGLAAWHALVRRQGLAPQLVLADRGAAAAAVALAIDALDLLHQAQVAGFCLAPADAAAAPLARRLRAEHCRVFGFSEAPVPTPSALYTSVHALNPPAGEEALSAEAAARIVAAMEEIVATSADGWVPLALAGQDLRARVPDLAQTLLDSRRLLRSLRATGRVADKGKGFGTKIRLKTA